MNDYEIDYSKYPNLEQEEESEKCALCEREKRLSFHHLIPKKMHRRKNFLKKFGKEEMKKEELEYAENAILQSINFGMKKR